MVQFIPRGKGNCVLHQAPHSQTDISTFEERKANEDYRLEEVTRQLYEARMNQGSTREKRLAEQTEHS